MYKLTFLGTSSGVPTKYRNVSALAIECLNHNLSGDKVTHKKNYPWILIDCGEGTQQQLLQTNLSLHQLAVICITHVHGDHCYGLAGLLSSMVMSGRKSSLKLIAPQAIAKLLDTLTITTELYFSFDIEFIAIEDVLKNHQGLVDMHFSSAHTLQLEITQLSHRVASYAFSLVQSITQVVLDVEKLITKGVSPSPIWGRLQKGEDVSLANGNILKSADYVKVESKVLKVVIAGDNDNPELLTEAVKNASLLVHESTYTQAIADKIDARLDGMDPRHSTARQVAIFATANHIPNLILTHFSARYQLFDDPESRISNMGHVREEVENYFEGMFNRQFWLAQDFDCYEVEQGCVYKVEK